jgi:hypothetical protein
MSKRWQKVEITYLKKHAASKSVAELAERFHTDVAAVEAKLQELRLGPGATAASDALILERYRQGMAALYGKKWQEAEELLGEVVRSSEQPELSARARQFAATARANAAGAEGEDPYLRAVFEKNRGDLEAVLALCEQESRVTRDGRFAYLAAAVESLRERLDRSAEHLRRAFELDSRNRGYARRDPDLENLRQSPEHAHLFEA